MLTGQRPRAEEREEEGNMRMKQAVSVLLACVMLAGCSAGGGKKEEGYKKIVDDFAEITLLQDQDGGAYEKALEAVGIYLKDSNQETLEKARTAVRGTIEQMEEDSGSMTEYEMDEEFKELLIKYGLDPEEYKINADMRSGYLAGYISSLQYLEYYLENEGPGGVTRESLEFTYQYDVEEQEYMGGFYYTGVNYWFAEWGEEETAYVMQQVVDQLQYLTAEDPVWENSRDAVERRLNVYLDTIEKHMDQWLKFIGENQEDLYQMQKELGK